MNQNTPDPYEHWLETGEYPDGSKGVKFVFTLTETNGILDDEPHFGCWGYNDLTPINAKRVRYAADAAMKACMDYLQNNLEHPHERT